MKGAYRLAYSMHSVAGRFTGMGRYYHVDVFTDVAYTGNSLAVFVDPPPLDSGQMLRITQELRHFETIFVTTLTEPDTVRARVFDLFGELDFAGHPVLGAAVTTRLGDGNLVGVLDQGRPELITPAAPLEPGRSRSRWAGRSGP
jgi:trans-2,3-dihydro-3-hydroxyanthranilate isomerase